VFPRSINPRGTTLIESVLALFLLTVASLLVVNLFQTALQRSRAGEQEHVARLIAERTLADIRGWSAEGNFRTISDLSTYHGLSYKDPEHSLYQVDVSFTPETLDIYCSSLEAAFPGDERTMTESCAKAEVTVSWASGMGSRNITLVTLVPESPRIIDRIVVSGAPPNMTADEKIDLTAQAFDTKGAEIKDIQFAWWIEAQTGIGRLTPSRQTNTAVFTNRARLRNGTTAVVNGTCRIAVFAAYDGQEVVGYSPVINLSF
jgi:type II secretory pathway pseudopilin PulG